LEPEKQSQVDRLVQEALDLEEKDRADFLERQCAGDQNLRAEVKSLLGFEKAANGFLEAPAIEVAGEALAGNAGSPLPVHDADTMGLNEPILSPQIEANQEIGHYRILSEIGRGGMGVVYKAEDMRLGRKVAVKFLPLELAADPTAFERFEQEARAASALDHPNICAVHQLGEHEGKPFIVMQLLEGQTLRDWIERAKGLPSLSEILEIGGQIAEGLEAAHSKGIIHRDIKPANIFLSARSQVKILDFGLAKFMEQVDLAEQPKPVDETFGTVVQDANLTRTSMVMGTPWYLSPEQIRHEKLDARTDLYSFGLVLYEMIARQQVFSGHTAGWRDAVLHRPAPPLRRLNPAVPEPLERLIGRMLEKDRNQRPQTAEEIRAELGQVRDSIVLAEKKERAAQDRAVFWREWFRRNRRRVFVAGLLLFIGGLALGVKHYRYIQATKLTAKDTIVVTDFSNNTGDSVFDDTLKQALTIALGQSPFLNVLPDRKVRATLKVMAKPPGTPITPEIASEVCQRSGSKAFVAGAIAALGSEYVLGLRAENCINGAPLGEEQVTARIKGDVIPALGEASSRLRAKLGESVASIKKFDVPLREATTSSLEALKEYTTGGKLENEQGPTGAIPHYLKAIALDPNFAKAYSSVSAEYFDAGESALAAQYSTKAYELRNHGTDLERVQIAATYNAFTTGNLENAVQDYQLWEQMRPNSPSPHTNLAYIYGQLGWNHKALTETLQGLRLGPSGEQYNNLMSAYLALGRLQEAVSTFSEAEARNMSPPLNHTNRYLIAFLQHDENTMQSEAAWAVGKPEAEAMMLYFEACTSAYHGELRKADELTQKARESAAAQNQKEAAVSYQADAALREALYGLSSKARTHARAIDAAAYGQDLQAAVAYAYAFAGDRVHAQELAGKMAAKYSENTLVRSNYLPVLRAQIALLAGHSQDAVELLKAALPYELGQPAQAISLNLYAAYVRANANLDQHAPAAAAAEFEKILNTPGVGLNEPIAALAHLGIARAYTAAGDNAKARSAYEDFLGIWKQADRGLPVLKQAKAEYARALTAK